MKKLFFTLSFFGLAFLSMAQSVNTSLRSAQTANIQLDSTINNNSKGKDKDIYTYNSNGKVNTITSSYFSGGVWVNSGKTANTYDANNKLIQCIDQSWDEVNLVWMDENKTVFSYNLAGNLTLKTGNSWNSTNSTWKQIWTESYTYNGNNQLIADTTSSGSGSSLFKYRFDYTYDVNNNLVSKIRYNWNNVNLVWEIYSKSEFVFDSNKLTSAIYYFWNGSEWVNDDKSNFIYDINGNLIEEISQSWNGSSWGLRDKTEYTYNNSYLLNNLNISDDNKTIYLKMLEIKLPYNNMMTSYKRYDETSMDVWSQYSDETYYYNNQASAVFNTQSSNLRINITNGKAEISNLPQGASVTVYNLQGVTIYDQKSTEKTVSVNLPARGIYIVKVGSESLKVIN